MPYRFFIPYLGMEIILRDDELEMVAKYSRGEISFRTYYEYIRPRLRASLVPRGYYRSVAMYLVGLYEEGRYTIITLEKCAEIYLEWYIKTKYLARKGHEFITEGRAEIVIQMPLDCWKWKEDIIRNKLNDILVEKYIEGWTKEYFFVPASDIDADFERAIILRVKTIDIAYEECEIKGELINFETGLKRKEEAVIVWDRELSKRIGNYIEEGVIEFIKQLKEICGE